MKRARRPAGSRTKTLVRAEARPFQAEKTPLGDLRQIGRRVEFQQLARAIDELHGGEDERGEADVLDVVNHEVACTVDVMLGIAGSVADFAGAPVSVVRTRVASRYRSPTIIQKVSVKSNTSAERETKVPDADLFGFGDAPRTHSSVAAVREEFLPQVLRQLRRRIRPGNCSS